MEETKQSSIAFCLTELETSEKTLEVLAEQLPKLRAAYAKHKGTEKEQETLADLGKAVKKLLEEVFSVIPRLTEYGDDSLAETAKRFYQRLKRFDYLGQADYTGLCAAILQFSESLPKADNTVNMGRLAHLANRARMGYFPTDLFHVAKLRRAMVFPETPVHLIDPCCGEGLALEAFSKGANAKTYGVELDEVRAEEAQNRLDRVGFGSYFHSRISL
ncbi:MAG: class I SAM-dependent methyltransferase, partial [Clostridia bacterium]|nr:class I SAM-dependent methyltransferase [Clostridia bacterium]